MKKSCYAYVPYNKEPVMTPYGHQLEALSKFRESDAVALFFEMGCGKSFTTLCLAEDKFRRGLIKGMLVVAPNDVHRQWYDDLVNGVTIDGKLYKEMSVDIEAQCVGGRGGAKDICEFDYASTFKFVSVNVDTFSQPTKWKSIVDWARSDEYMIVIDEATCIKNCKGYNDRGSSARAKRLIYGFDDILSKGKCVLASKHNKYRVILTGTPVTNGTVDLWALMEFLQPNYFGRNYYSFQSYYAMYTVLKADEDKKRPRDITIPLTEKTWQGVKDCYSYAEAFFHFGVSEDTYFTIKHQVRFMGAYKHADELRKEIDPASLFKRLTDCVDMPEQIYTVRNVGMNKEQEKAYKSMLKENLAVDDGILTTAKNGLSKLLRLQQISDGFIVPDLPDEDEEETPIHIDDIDVMPVDAHWLGESCPKLDALMRDVESCDKPMLILTKYTAEAARIYDMCVAAGYKTGLFTGWRVEGGIEEFKAGKLEVLVANENKIARGFNLQIAHTTLFYSNSFSMEVRQQAEFRTFRMGQKNSCVYVDYIASDIDKVVSNALKLKKDLLDYIRDSKCIPEIVF